MIDEEKIYEEANGVYDEKFLNDTYGIIYYDNGDEDEAHTPCQVTEAFIMGAQWAQKEFIKSLWHDASEKPEEGKKCIGRYKCIPLDAISFKLPIAGTTWDEYIHYSSLDKWCYADDIMPKEGGEKWQQ